MLSFFRTIKGNCIPLEYEPTNSIEEIKKKLSKKMNLPWNELCILFCGKECENKKIANDFKFWLNGRIYVIYKKPKE